ncbi:Nn.00g048690.m01.CDS01 [Neocucurbitaria sp. VM-36]
MFETQFISFDAQPEALELRGLPILIDPDDFEGIRIAAYNLANDLEKVTGQASPIWTSIEQPSTTGVILIGSTQRSRFVREITESSHADNLSGAWETFQTQVQVCPWPCAERMLVLAGSDKRGTIYACYTLAEQIGVSPWHYWADVPVANHSHIYALPASTRHGPPSVQYRGIFINDEAPALTDWVHENFGAYNSRFYAKVFELLLRMKANFLWPAMWSGFPEPGSIFFTDDPENQKLADSMGIVIGTSHHEPMGCNMSEWRASQKGEWAWETNKSNISEYFQAGARRSQPYESLLTLGMRGDSDVSIISDDPKATLKDVIEMQREIIQDVHGKVDGVGQVMALYKEVQEYYEQGLEIPKDVTLLFADDNFGNIRRLPTQQERDRSGSFGIYYHLEYVGTPRSYKWLNANSAGKIQYQLRNAYDNGIQKLWVFNVGDIKPQELPLSLAMSLAWNIESFTGKSIPKFFDAYAARETGLEYVYEVSNLLQGHDRLMAIRRHEHIEPDTFSILNYREAERILQRHLDLDDRASKLFESAPAALKAAIFQLVLHPIRASRINTELRVTQALNKLHGLQRRNSTNALAHRCLALFDEDWALAERYHDNEWTGKKWNHIMKQPHYGYYADTWHAPSRDMITGLSFVQLRQDSTRIAGQMGIMVEGHAGVRPGVINEESDRTHPSRGDLVKGLILPTLTPYGPEDTFFEIFARGTVDIDWHAQVPYTWIILSRTQGLIGADEEAHRIIVSIDWTQCPPKFNEIITITISAKSGGFEHVHLPIINRSVPTDCQASVEASGYISIEACNMAPLEAASDWIFLPSIGRTSNGGIALSPPNTKTLRKPPVVTYPLYTFTSTPTVKVILYFTMCLDSRPSHTLTYDMMFDSQARSEIRLLETPPPSSHAQGEDTVGLPVGLPTGWMTAVQDNVWKREHVFEHGEPGKHMLLYRALEPGLVLEKVVVDLGGVRESYLGPPPTGTVVDGRLEK